MRRVRRSLAARSIVAQRPEIIVMFACAELGSILDPGDDLRCFELVLTVLTRLIKVSRADSIVLKCRSDPPPPLYVARWSELGLSTQATHMRYGSELTLYISSLTVDIMVFLSSTSFIYRITCIDIQYNDTVCTGTGNARSPTTATRKQTQRRSHATTSAITTFVTHSSTVRVQRLRCGTLGASDHTFV
jgi:hypothetical protein